jgi:ATP-dependent Clp protease ATP-binding subunit ClpA
VDELKTSLAAKGIQLSLSEPVVDLLADKGYDSMMGARPLSRKIDELIRVPLSKKILFEGLRDCTIQAQLKDDVVVFEIVSQVPHVDSEGFVVVNS